MAPTELMFVSGPPGRSTKHAQQMCPLSMPQVEFGGSL